MKKYILLLAIAISSCTTHPTAPPATPATPDTSKTDSLKHPLPSDTVKRIPNLSVPDTLDFGFMPLGSAKSMILEFKNTGSDTLEISQSASKTNIFSYTYGANFSLVPGQSYPYTINCSEPDTLPHIAWDTIRSKNAMDVIVLRNGWKFYSTMFPLGPKSISVSLTGLIGKDAFAGSPHDFSFGFGANNLKRWDDTLVFTSTAGSSDNYTNDDQSTYVSLHLDTITHTIDWLKATYTHDVAHTIQPHWSTHNSESLNVHNIPLSLEGNTWVAKVDASSLPMVIDTATYEANYTGDMGGELANLQSIIGYESGASLYITIQ